MFLQFLFTFLKGPLCEIFACFTLPISIDGQVRLVRLVRFQIDSFHLFLCQQTDKQRTSICTRSKTVTRLRRIAWAFVFRFLFETASYIYVHCRKSQSISSFPSDISVLFHEHYITNISEKYSPLYVLMSFQKYFGFFRTSNLQYFVNMTKDSEVNLKNFLLIPTCSTSSWLCSLIGQVGRVFASYLGGPWIKSQLSPFFFISL